MGPSSSIVMLLPCRSVDPEMCTSKSRKLRTYVFRYYHIFIVNVIVELVNFFRSLKGMCRRVATSIIIHLF